MPRELLHDEPESVYLQLDGDEANAIEDYLELIEFDAEAAALIALLVRKLLSPAGMTA
jgi:hypothetical protein